MRHYQGHIILFAIRHRPLGMQQVRAVHVSMVRRQDHNSAVGETCRIKFGKDRGDITVNVAQAVQIVVVSPAPACLFIGNFPHQGIV